jgi:beta-lactam-binding protein with PASTA domain
MARPVPADLEDALAASPSTRERFWSMSAERKDAWVRWIERARLPRTRRRRIAETVRRLSGPAAPATAVEGESVAAVPLPRDDWGAWLIGLVLLAGLAAFLVWYTIYRHDDGSKGAVVAVTAKATVPKVVGIRYQAAVFQLKEAKLASKLVRRAATRPRGIVIGQKPKAGAAVPQGTPVTLVVSNGRPGVKMPDVVGLAAADAVRALEARKLTPTLQQVASKEASGTVVRQEPKAGSRAKPGTNVVLQVAKAAAPVSVPDVTGQLEQQATAALQQAGLAAHAVQVPSSQPKGTVVAQSPAAGQKVAKGSTVRLNVSSGRTTTRQQTSGDSAAGSAGCGVQRDPGAVACQRSDAERDGRVRDADRPGSGGLGDRDLRRLCQRRLRRATLRRARLKFLRPWEPGRWRGSRSPARPGSFFLFHGVFT